MSSNPYESPNASGGASPNAQAMVQGPATGLMVTAGIGIFLQVLGLLMNVLGAGMGAAAGGDEAALNILSGGIGIVMNIVGLIVGVVIFMGAQKMKNLQSAGFAMAASVLAMIPCLSPCCLLGLPIGIWSIMVLQKPEVKSAFR